MTTKSVALRSPYMRSSDGATSGTCAGPDGSGVMPSRCVTCSDAAVQDRGRLRRAPHAERGDGRGRERGGDARERPAQRDAGDRRREQDAGEQRRALTTPKVVGRRCVLTRSSVLPPP